MEDIEVQRSYKSMIPATRPKELKKAYRRNNNNPYILGFTEYVKVKVKFLIGNICCHKLLLLTERRSFYILRL